MKKRILQKSINTNQGGNNINYSINPQNKKNKYKLIMSIDQFKKPVLSVVKSIINKGQQKQNLIYNLKKNQSNSQSHKDIKQSNNILINKIQDKQEMYGCSQSNQIKKMKQKQQFTSKVHKFFATKKYNYTGDDEDNIDRLNAKLDKYISRYLGHRQSLQ